MFSKLKEKRSIHLWAVLPVLIWLFVQYLFFDTFIFHDTWNHNFPQTYEVSKASSCMQFAYWLPSDTGTPTVIYAISFSLTQVIKAILIHVWSCTHPTPYSAMLTYKGIAIFSYLLFSAGMFVLGKVLFRQRLTAIYLMSGSLFAGACLQGQHSDEVIYILFWVPWCATALVLASKNLHGYLNPHLPFFYFNIGALLFCLCLMDMYPHIPALAAVYAAVICAILYGCNQNFIARNTLHQLWPMATVLLLTILGLYCIEQQIFLFQPQHSRTAITLTPDQIGQTAFTQPSALFGSLFPLSFTAGFDEIASRYVWKGFIYRLDLLLIYIGTIPFFLSISLLFSNKSRRATFGWLVFTIMLAATSMQTTGFYYAIFHLPFFNLFRSYFHFWDYVVFSFLVLSAYGFENVMQCNLGERIKILKKTFIASFAIYIIGFTSLVLFIIRATGHGPGLGSYLWEIALDATIIIGSLLSISIGINKKISSNKIGVILIGFLIFTQTIYISHIYLMLGEKSEKTFSRYQTNIELLTPIADNKWDLAGEITRIQCEKASGCNLSQRPATSLKDDTDGSFFRDLHSPIIRKNLPANIKSSLAGVTFPILWATPSITYLPSYEALDTIIINTNNDNILKNTTYVINPIANFEYIKSTHEKLNISFSNMKITPNNISFEYNSNSQGYVNISTTANNGWKATLNGYDVPIIRSYYNYMTIKINPGEGQITLNYSNSLDKYFFWSRNFLALLGLVCMGHLFFKFACFKPASK